MKQLKLLLPLFLVLLTGCSSSPQVAYWQDSSYKSPMDFDAEQRHEIKNELNSVQNSIKDILDNVKPTLPPGTSTPETTPPLDKTIVVSGADGENKMITAIRERILLNQASYGSTIYYGVPLDNSCASKIKPDDAIEASGYLWVNAVKLATDTTNYKNDVFKTLLPVLTDGVYIQIAYDPTMTDEYTIKVEDLDRTIAHQFSIAFHAKPEI